MRRKTYIKKSLPERAVQEIKKAVRVFRAALIRAQRMRLRRRVAVNYLTPTVKYRGMCI